MARVLYTAHAHVTGGREDGHGRTADGQLEVDLRVPEEMGGTGGGANPEELFALVTPPASRAPSARSRGAVALDAGPAAIDSAVSLLPGRQRRLKLAVTLDVTLPSVADPETAVQLIREAHQVCPYSNATRGNIDVGLLLDGKPIRGSARCQAIPGFGAAAYARRSAMTFRPANSDCSTG